MIIKRQKLYSKASKMIKGALIAAPVGYVAGTILGNKKGIKEVTKEEKQKVAKERIEENNKKIKKYKKAIKDTKSRLGKNWREMSDTEIAMNLDEVDYLKRDINSIKKENKDLKSGNYKSIQAHDTPTGEKYLLRGQALGTAAGMGTGALLGYGLHKILKK